MPKAKPLTKEEIQAANNRTKSCRAASRYLHVSYIHYKKWAKLYVNKKTGVTLFDEQLNPSGHGIRKHISRKGDSDYTVINDIIDGRVSALHFEPSRIKELLVKEKVLAECCSRCSFSEKRVIDQKTPLILNFKNKDSTNYYLYNIELLCYNCYYLYIGEVFTAKDIRAIEIGNDATKVNLNRNFELDDHYIDEIHELGEFNKNNSELYEEGLLDDDGDDLDIVDYGDNG